MGELYANPAASQAMLDDAAFDLESWLASEIAMEFARAEGTAFVNGNGTNQPRGFLPRRPARRVMRPRLRHAAVYRLGQCERLRCEPRTQADRPGPHAEGRPPPGRGFVMNSSTLAEVRKLKTADGAFLWQPGMVEGQPDRLLGYPVIEAEDMPDVAADAFPIAFGNFRAGYLIAERRRDHDPARSVHQQALRPLLRHQARGRPGARQRAIKLLKIEAFSVC
jgi:predicted phage gp36 major capsid-like protein